MSSYTLDAETLRPAIIAMSLYLSTVVLAHKFAPRTPSALVAHVASQRDSAMSGAIFIGIIATVTHVLNEELI